MIGFFGCRTASHKILRRGTACSPIGKSRRGARALINHALGLAAGALSADPATRPPAHGWARGMGPWVEGLASGRDIVPSQRAGRCR